jgi:hypothetical protein
MVSDIEIVLPPDVRVAEQQLICPSCGAIGTFNLHHAENSRPWRSLCKYCGYYCGPDAGPGRICYPSNRKGCWCFLVDADKNGDTETRTPKQVVEQVLANTWPWKK